MADPKNLPTKKSPGHMTSLVNSITHLNTNPSQSLLKTEEEETPPSSFYKVKHYPIPKADKHTARKPQENPLMNREPKVFKKNISNKKIIHYDQMRCITGMQGQFNTHISMDDIPN